ncbi:MAG: hypothetical protein GVY11_04405 [Gammaproteobacteria bacterium]|jgi:hypothetical protein|nr:hypothetical protein [Gammaproteobacteria bacterium]
MLDRSRGFIRPLGGWLMVIAIAAGVVYALYVVRWSGERVAEVPLQTSGETRSGGIELAPGMNPVRATLETDMRARDGRVYRYSVMLVGESDDVKAVLDDSGDHRLSSGSDSSERLRERSASLNLGLIEVPVEGEYTVIASLSPHRRTRMDDARLLLQANTATFDARIIGGLAGLLVLGLLASRWGHGKASGPG